MEYTELWSFAVILISAFVIGWAAETAQVMIPRAVALSILAWLQTLPEFAVEATIAWEQKKDLMIANLTGSLRLLVGLGWPMIFFVYFITRGMREKKWNTTIHLAPSDSLGVMFLFVSILYFTIILLKDSLNCFDSLILTAIYVVYLVIAIKLPPDHEEEVDDLPWVGQQILRLKKGYQGPAIVSLFLVGGIALYFSAHPFVLTLEKWAVYAGIPAFVFVQWFAPFLSEFPEKVTAFNWARQPNKEGLALMNMVNSNINQWTMLAAMIPLVFNLSLGRFESITFDDYHHWELALTIAQSLLGGLLLLDLRFSLWEATGIFVLWAVQFFESLIGSQFSGFPDWFRFVISRHGVTYIYFLWSVWVFRGILRNFIRTKRWPKAIEYFLSPRSLKKN